MNCVRCNNAIATHYVVDVSDGTRRELYLCKDCVVMVGLTMTWPIDVDPFMGYGNIRCECGMTLDMFRMLQRMGCAKCYDVLPIDKIINQYHNATQHIGKTPTTINDDNSIKERIFMLTQAMEVAIRSEHYERAAYLRDQIKLLESMYKEHNKTNEA